MSETFSDPHGNGNVQPFIYAAAMASEAPPANGKSGSEVCDIYSFRSAEALMEKEIQAREAAAWEAGVQEGESRMRAACEQALAQERAALAAALAKFAEERAAYFRKVEAEVVHLALAVARKVLHREAQMDRMFLAGAVRVALEKVATGSSLKLKVHPEAHPAWQEFLRGASDWPVLPELAADPAVEPGQCVLETTLGATRFGAEPQLKEIEQGFFDLLAARPSPSTTP